MPPLEVPALPPTRRLFDEDPSRLAFDARVFAMTPGASDAGRSGPEVALDATAFFAEDGGQLSDRGSIAGIPVLGVRIDPQGTIWHLLAHDPPPEAAWREGAIVHGEVDARVRRDRRQQHSGQHLLSRAFSVVLGRETVSFHMGEDVSTIDLEGEGKADRDRDLDLGRDPDRDLGGDRDLDLARIAEAETQANGWIWDDVPVETRAVPRPGQLPLRIVDMGGIDVQPCCGTHVARTGEVGSIHVLKQERVRGRVRLHFVCGERALAAFRTVLASADAAARLASAAWTDLPRVVGGLQESSREAERRARSWQERWAALEGDRLLAVAPRTAKGVAVVASWIEGGDAELLRRLAGRVTEAAASAAAVVLLAGGDPGGRSHWVAAASPILPADAPFDARATLQAALAPPLRGKGGGTVRFAQGSCEEGEAACRERLDRFRATAVALTPDV